MSASMIRGLHMPALLFHFLAMQQPCEVLDSMICAGGDGKEEKNPCHKPLRSW